MRADNSRHLTTAARQRAEQTRARAVRALRRLDETGKSITFEAVAAEAGVSRSWLYAGKVAQPGCLAGPDPVFDPGVGPVPDFQVGQLTAAGVGEERGEPVPVRVGEPQLRAGVGSFPAHDQ